MICLPFQYFIIPNACRVLTISYEFIAISWNEKKVKIKSINLQEAFILYFPSWASPFNVSMHIFIDTVQISVIINNHSMICFNFNDTIICIHSFFGYCLKSWARIRVDSKRIGIRSRYFTIKVSYRSFTWLVSSSVGIQLNSLIKILFENIRTEHSINWIMNKPVAEDMDERLYALIMTGKMSNGIFIVRTIHYRLRLI